MKIVRKGYDAKADFKIKIGNKYVTVAELKPWFLSKYLHKYSLYFYYYGKEFEEGVYASHHINGNVSITLRKQEYEDNTDFLLRVSKIVQKKLYIIGSSVLEEIKEIEVRREYE